MDCKDELVVVAQRVCLADPGDEYLVFREGGGSITINLSGNRLLRLIRVNPYTGQQKPLSIQGGQSITLTTSGDSIIPFKAHWQ